MADRPPKDPLGTRVARRFHRAKDRFKDTFHIGPRSAPGSRSRSETQSTSSLPNIPLEGELTRQEAGSTSDDMPVTPMTAREVRRMALSFTQLLIKKLPDVVDVNPVKMALEIVKVIVEIKDAVKDNMDTVDRRIVSIGSQMAVLEDVRIDGWGPADPETVWLGKFTSTLAEEFENLRRLKLEPMVVKVVDYEDQKAQIAAMFERVNEARIEFELYTNLRVLRAALKIEKSVLETEKAVMRSFRNELQPSHMADHQYHFEGATREMMRREPCTPGTRTRILRNIIDWSGNTSPESEDVYWLFGPAGSGKTTIAYTVARFFEAAAEADNTILLGGNFLCSRQFAETRSEARIIRTLVYQLAGKCPGFAKALNQLDNFDAIHQGVGPQIRHFLVGLDS